MITKFGKDLAQGHKSCCPWRNNPSPKTFTDFSGETNATFFANFKAQSERLRLLAQLTPLPEISQHALSRLNCFPAVSSEGALRAFFSAPPLATSSLQVRDSILAERRGKRQFEIVSPDEEQTIQGLQQRAAILALCGWDTVSSEQQLKQDIAASQSALSTNTGQSPSTGMGAGHMSGPAQFVVCNFCQRQAALWNFESSAGKLAVQIPVPSSTLDDSCIGDIEILADSSTSSSTSKPKRPRTLTPFDPLGEHKWFCPWVAASYPPSALGSTATSTDGDAGERAKAGRGCKPEVGWERCMSGVYQYIQSRKAIDNVGHQQESGSNLQLKAQMDPEETLRSIRKLLGSA